MAKPLNLPITFTSDPSNLANLPKNACVFIVEETTDNFLEEHAQAKIANPHAETIGKNHLLLDRKQFINIIHAVFPSAKQVYIICGLHKVSEKCELV